MFMFALKNHPDEESSLVLILLLMLLPAIFLFKDLSFFPQGIFRESTQKNYFFAKTKKCAFPNLIISTLMSFP